MSEEQTTATATEATTVAATQETTMTTDLDTLTVAQLETMTTEDLQKIKKDVVALFDVAIEKWAQEEWAAFKEKAVSAFATFKAYVLPIVKYGAGLAVLLRVFGVI